MSRRLFQGQLGTGLELDVGYIVAGCVCSARRLQAHNRPARVLSRLTYSMCAPILVWPPTTRPSTACSRALKSISLKTKWWLVRLGIASAQVAGFTAVGFA